MLTEFENLRGKSQEQRNYKNGDLRVKYKLFPNPWATQMQRRPIEVHVKKKLAAEVQKTEQRYQLLKP